MKYIVILFIWYLLQANAFITQLNTNVKNIVSSQAILTTITERFNMEMVTNENIINDIANFQKHPLENIGAFILIAGSIYFQEKQIKYIDYKLKNIELFTKIKKRTNTILIIFLFVFTRNIENAV